MEANNVAAMREALKTMSNLFEQGVICTSYANSAEEMEQIEELYRKAKAALALPRRQCDVGTAEEQFERWRAFCVKHDKDCTGCPCDNDGHTGTLAHCFAKWAQMSYKKEKKGGHDDIQKN